MKKRNIIITLGAAAALTIGIFVACSKDVNKQTTDNMTYPAPKSNEAAKAMFYIWEKSDSAYRSNPTAFLNVCCNSYEGFLDITNIPSSLMTTFRNEVQKQAHAAWQALGAAWFPNECVPCSEGGLPAFGQNVADLRRMLDTLRLVDSSIIVPNFMPYMDSCIVVCQLFRGLAGDDLDMCLFNCNLSRAIKKSQQLYMAVTDKPWEGFE